MMRDKAVPIPQHRIFSYILRVLVHDTKACGNETLYALMKPTENGVSSSLERLQRSILQDFVLRSPTTATLLIKAITRWLCASCCQRLRTTIFRPYSKNWQVSQPVDRFSASKKIYLCKLATATSLNHIEVIKKVIQPMKDTGKRGLHYHCLRRFMLHLIFNQRCILRQQCRFVVSIGPYYHPHRRLRARNILAFAKCKSKQEARSVLEQRPIHLPAVPTQASPFATNSPASHTTASWSSRYQLYRPVPCYYQIFQDIWKAVDDQTICYSRRLPLTGILMIFHGSKPKKT